MNVVQWFFMCLVALCSYVRARPGGHGGGHEHVKFIIHYPVQTIKHTHTVYKTIHHGGGGGGGGQSTHHSHGGKPFTGFHH